MRKKNESEEDSIIKSFQEILSADKNVFGETPWYLHSGNYALDWIVSGRVKDGGWPVGKCIEIFGPPSTGKSLLILRAGAEMQKRGGTFIMADTENRWNGEFARLHGVDLDKTLVWHPQTVEEFGINVHKILQDDNAKNILFACDSLAALSVLKEVDDMDEGSIKADQGRKAQKIKAIMRVLPSGIQKKECILIVANHIIDNPQIMFASTKLTPGGRGVPFASTVRAELLSNAYIKIEGKDRPVGTTLKIKIAKNSETVPLGETNVDVLWSKGINPFSGLLDIAVDLGIIQQGGGWYQYGDKKFRANQIAEIAKETDLLENPTWKKPYFLEE